MNKTVKNKEMKKLEKEKIIGKVCFPTTKPDYTVANFYRWAKWV